MSGKYLQKSFWEKQRLAFVTWRFSKWALEAPPRQDVPSTTKTFIADISAYFFMRDFLVTGEKSGLFRRLLILSCHYQIPMHTVKQ